jgi:hypothetical protein
MGYFLPALLGLCATSLAGELILGPTGAWDLSRDEWLTVIGIGAVLSWATGVLLLGINFQLIRAIEGYGPINPLGVIKSGKQKQLTRLREQIETLEQKFESKSLTIEEHSLLTALKGREITEFPDRLSNVLPTDLGNRIASFESYSLKMYGLDAVTFWDHLNIVMPKESKAPLEEAKSQFDFWLNMMFMPLIVICNVCIMCAISRDGSDIVPAIGSLAGSTVVLWGSYNAAKTSVMLWGDTVKAAFDIYIGEVVSRFDLPDSSFERLRKLSLAIAYHSPEYLAEARSGDDSAASELTAGSS